MENVSNLKNHNRFYTGYTMKDFRRKQGYTDVVVVVLVAIMEKGLRDETVCAKSECWSLGEDIRAN